MGGSADCYRATKARVLDHVAGLDDALAVPATPGWDVRALLAHLVGVAHDVATGDVLEYAQPGWTRRQVASRQGQTRADLLAEWDEVTPALTAVLDDPEAAGLDEMFRTAPLADLIIHRHDLREADGLFPDLAPDETPYLWDRRLEILGLQLAMEGLAPLAIGPDDGPTTVVGDGEPVATVTAPFTDLWRSLQGRRTRAAVRAFDWDGDPEPYLGVWPGLAFSWPEN